MLKKRLSLRLPLTLLLVVGLAAVSAAASFDSALEKIASLRQNKKYTELTKKLQNSSASPELEDLRLFLLAESLKNQGDGIGARKIYEKLLNTYPESETAFQARLPHFLLLLEKAGENDLTRLEGLARSLSTSWQRGTAFEKLAQLPFVKPGKMSRLVLMAIREFHADKPFYKSIPASHELLKKILGTPETFVLEDDEWLELLVLAGEEGLLKGLYPKKAPVFSRLLGKRGAAFSEIFRALSLFQANKTQEALGILNALIARQNVNSLVKAFAGQEKAYIHYQQKDYLNAINAYRMALDSAKFPVNVRACQYRLMRSAFMAGRDSECLEMLNRLIKADMPEPLLPIHIYEMGLERYDSGQVQNATPFFMLFARSFPGHYRADDALGYAILASGRNSVDGKTLLKLLEAKYGNSFFITWVAPELQTKQLKSRAYQLKKLADPTIKRVKAWKKLWKSEFASFAREEARKMTDKFPANMNLYYEIIEICRQNHDYNQLTAFAERLARQLLEAGKSLADMPDWAWKAFYPEAYMTMVTAEAKKNSIDPYWVLSIMREESHFNPDTLSRSNAHSLMQILPSTGKWIAEKVGHRRFSKSDLWKPEVNIKFGCWYLKYLADLFNGDLHLASASYNGGQGNIQRKVEKGPYAHLGVLERLDRVPLPETRDYYKKVMGSYWNYKRLYK